MSSSVHIDNKRKDILILGKGPTQGLDDMTLAAEGIYPINFTEPNKRFVLSLYYNGSSISKDFTINNIIKKKQDKKEL